jgi:hypothetical protein
MNSAFPLRKYPYFDTEAGLVWSNYPESYTGSSISTDRASHAKQVKGDDPDKRDILVLQAGGWSWGYNSTPENTCSIEKLLLLERRGYGPPRAVMPDEEEEMYIYLLVS